MLKATIVFHIFFTRRIMTEFSIVKVADRNLLEPRPAPYFHRLEKGGYIGYRKLTHGEGSWVVRWRDEHDIQHNKTLGTFDSFDSACKAARDWIERRKGGVNEDVTVEEACRRYVTNRRKEKGEPTAKDAEGRFNRTVYGKKFGNIKLASLKTVHITDWRNDLVDVDEDEEDPDAERRAKDSANRNLATLKAALNLAYRMGLVSSPAPWNRVESFQRVAKGRDRFLNITERKQLITAATPELERLIRALLLTAARTGEMFSATVGDLDRSGLLTLDGKTGRRTIPLPPEARKHLIRCAGDRKETEPLVLRDDGEAWNRYYARDAMQKARAAANLPDDVVLYTLRHVAISEMLVSGIDAMQVARIAGTSIAMIQRHYGHLIKDQIVAQLAKVKML